MLKTSDGKVLSNVRYVTVTGGGGNAQGTIDITENGEHDVAAYAKANVNVPMPERIEQLIVEENGLRDVYAYVEELIVDVPTSGSGGDEQFAAFVSGTLENVVIPEGVTDIRAGCFSRQENIKSVQFPSTLKTIGVSAFDESGLTGTLVFPASIESIYDYAFSYLYANVQEVVFKGTPTSLSSDMFHMSYGITTIKVPWGEGAVANAPWGAPEATVIYNYTEG